MEFVTNYLANNTDDLIEMVTSWGGKLLGALVVLWIGFKIVGVVKRMVQKAFGRTQLDPSLEGFLLSVIGMTLKVLVFITAAGVLGIEMTSFIALLGAAGLAVGMALQGALSHFAGGVMILLFRPFKNGDLIEAQGFLGHVKQIGITATEIKTLDNKTVFIPNGPLSGGTIKNYSTEPQLRVDLEFGIGYDDDIDQAKKVIMEIVKARSDVLSTPAEPFVAVMSLGDSAVNLVVRVWTKTETYWDVYFGLNEAVKKAFDSNKISIPYPHQEVYMHTVS